jgi:hypothetical protein
MANELQLLPNATNIPEDSATGYQRQNTNILSIQNGIDTTNPKIIENKIFIPAWGIVDANGVLFKFTNDVEIPIPDINTDYYMYITDNGDGTGNLDLTEAYPTFISSKNGWYTSDNERVLNHFYMRKTLVKRKSNNENIGSITFIDVNTEIAINHTTTTPLSVKRINMAAATLGDGSVLFGGGYYTQFYAYVDKYDVNGVHTMLENLSVIRYCPAATLGDGSVLFGGGGGNSTTGSLNNAMVDRYDINGVHTMLEDLSVARHNFPAASILRDGSVLFGGGEFGDGLVSTAVDRYDINGVHTTLENLSVAKAWSAAASLGGGSVLFGGGSSTLATSGATMIVDRYGNEIGVNFPVGSKYKFINDISEKVVKSETTYIATPNRGYVRYNGTVTI